MKKNNTISALCGIRQKDMALLLNVTLSQWAMFELGKRNLPIHAKLLLADILGHLEKEKRAECPASPSAKDPKEHSYLLIQLQENHRKRVVLSRRLDMINRKQKTIAPLLSLTAFLAAQGSLKSEASKGLLNKLTVRASGALEKNSPMAARQLEIQLQLLDAGRQLLQQLANDTSGKPNVAK